MLGTFSVIQCGGLFESISGCFLTRHPPVAQLWSSGGSSLSTLRLGRWYRLLGGSIWLLSSGGFHLASLVVLDAWKRLKAVRLIVLLLRRHKSEMVHLVKLGRLQLHGLWKKCQKAVPRMPSLHSSCAKLSVSQLHEEKETGCFKWQNVTIMWSFQSSDPIQETRRKPGKIQN